MKVSTRGEYGVRAMVALAHGYGEGPMSITEIARQSSVPPAYLEQLIAPLRRALAAAICWRANRRRFGLVIFIA
jgi:Rrf2 family cysteine metabolism transcriptional repressor